MGTSSTLFNAGLLRLDALNQSNIATAAIKSVLNGLSKGEVDVSQVPNPFYGWTKQENPVSHTRSPSRRVRDRLATGCFSASELWNTCSDQHYAIR